MEYPTNFLVGWGANWHWHFENYIERGKASKNTIKYNRILLSHKKKEIVPFATTWLDLEIIVPSEVRQRQIPPDITYVWNPKYDTNELIYKTETDSQT